MDRLPLVGWAFLGVALVALAGCKVQRQAPAPSTRYEAVKAAESPVSHWCDRTFTSAGPRLTLPSLAGGTVVDPARLPGGSKGRRLWVNLWATWCVPCLREMPLLLKWQADLRSDGVDVDVLFLSLDEDAQAFDKFLAEHKSIPATKVARVESQAAYEQWIKSYLKDPATPIPIHLLGAAEGGLRCIRSGSLHEGDYPAAKAALR